MSQEINFLEVSLRNFMSFGNNTTSIDLTIPGTILVNGDNVETGGANGVGKTTMINAICYALYNNPFDKISLQKLINNTNSQKDTLMEVRLRFLKGDKEYEIYRCRGSTTNIEIKCDDVDITLDSVGENDRFIVELIGVSYDLFTNVVVFAGGMEPFLQKPIGEQRKLIEELFNITTLSEKAKKLKEKIKITEGDINIQEAIIKEQQGAILRYNKQVKEAEERVIRFEEDKEASIAKLKQQLASIEGVDFEAEQKLHDELKTLQTEFSSLTQDEKAATKEIATQKTSLSKVEKELEHLRDSKCPYCLQQFADAPAKIDELEKRQKELTELISDLEEAQGIVKAGLTECGDKLARVKAAIQYPNIDSLRKILTEAETMKQKLIDLEKSANPHLEAFEQLLGETIKEADTKKLDELKSKLEHQQFLLKLLTDKNSFIRRRIINKTIPFLNGRLNYYTSELGLPHIVKFDDDMSCTVSEYGRELDFGNLSNGEKKRVNMALSLAFRDVLHHMHARMNLMFIDEIDGGSLDTIGIDAIIKMIKKKSREDDLAIWIISHRPEMVGRFEHEVTVRKENGFSSILFD